MGIDFLDCCFSIEKEFNLRLDRGKLDLPRFKSGTGVSITAADLLRWVEDSIVSTGKGAPTDIWPRVRSCIAATIMMSPDEVALASRLIEDLGFT